MPRRASDSWTATALGCQKAIGPSQTHLPRVHFLGHSGIRKEHSAERPRGWSPVRVCRPGSIGPLKPPKATEVHFSEIPTFAATYQPRGRLQHLIFALEQELKHTLGTLPDDEVPELEESDRL